MVTVPAKSWMVTRRLSDRRCPGLIGMSANALRGKPKVIRTGNGLEFTGKGSSCG
jgi:hypothetical protein